MHDWFIDADTHITEPGDVWTSRLPQKFQDAAPRMIRTDDGVDVWQFGRKERKIPVGATAVAGWPSPSPPSQESRRVPARRLRRQGAPRVHGRDRRLGDGPLPQHRRLRQRDLPRARRPGAHARVRAGLQRLAHRVDLPRPAPLHPGDGDPLLGRRRRGGRDPPLSRDLGHRAILFTSAPQDFGMPLIGDPHWNPIWTPPRRSTSRSACTSAAATSRTSS